MSQQMRIISRHSAGRWLGLLGAIALMPVTALAQPGAELSDVVVTASGHEQSEIEAPASISVIDREALESRYYGDVTDALREVPGVIVTGGGGGDRGRDISIRGLPSKYTRILVDGRPVSTRETRPNGSAGFEHRWLPPLQAIERIEVVRGPMSTLYGSDAIGGVINVITRKIPDSWHGSAQIDQLLQQDSDSGDVTRSNLYLGGPLKEGLLGLQIFGDHERRQEDNIVDGYDDRELRSLRMRLTLTPTPHHDLALDAGVSDQRRRATVGRSVPTEGCRGGCEDSEGAYTQQSFALTHRARLSFGTLESYAQRETAENRRRDMEIDNTDVRSALVVPLAAHTLSLGGEYIAEDLSDTTSNRISDRTRVDGSKWALFAENEWQVWRAFAITAGLRYDDDENFGGQLSPRLYGVWRMAERWVLKGGVSTGYRSPDLRELTPDWGQISRGGNVYGNPDLEPETSRNYELGLRYSAAATQFGFTVFHNDFEDKITRVACPVSICTDGPNDFGADPTYRINVDEAITRGAELSVSASLPASLSLRASYTFTDSEQKSGEYRGEPLTQLPEHLAILNLAWQGGERLQPWARLSYRGKESQPTTGPSQSALVAPSYTFLDVGASLRVSDTLQLRAGLYNLLDKSVRPDEYGFVEDGRRLWLGVGAEF